MASMPDITITIKISEKPSISLNTNSFWVIQNGVITYLPLLVTTLCVVPNANPLCLWHMSDSDLLDMHYFLTEDDDWDGDEPEEGFYIDLFQ